MVWFWNLQDVSSKYVMLLIGGLIRSSEILWGALMNEINHWECQLCGPCGSGIRVTWLSCSTIYIDWKRKTLDAADATNMIWWFIRWLALGVGSYNRILWWPLMNNNWLIYFWYLMRQQVTNRWPRKSSNLNTQFPFEKKRAEKSNRTHQTRDEN